MYLFRATEWNWACPLVRLPWLGMLRLVAHAPPTLSVKMKDIPFGNFVISISPVLEDRL